MGTIVTNSQVLKSAVNPVILSGGSAERRISHLKKSDQLIRSTRCFATYDFAQHDGVFGVLFFFFIFLNLSCSSPTFAQTELPKKAQKYFDEANEHIAWNRFAEAETAYLEVLKLEPKYLPAQQKLSYIYMQTRQYEKAYQPLIALTKAEPKPIVPAFFELAKVCLATGRYAEGLDYYKQWVTLRGGTPSEEGKTLERNLNFAVEYAKNSPNKSDIDIKPLNALVNTPQREYFPTVTADGSKLFFTRHTVNNNFVNEDLFFSKWTGSDWDTARSVGSNVNTLSNEAASSISPDGRKLFFTICESNKGFGGCDIWVADRMGDLWLPAKNLGPVFNSKEKETQPCLSGDGRSLYFVSGRKDGGEGMLDIWVSSLQGDGTWGKPENLGDAINTPGDEQRPFIHPDNHTLYFSSNGHAGFGGTDIFMSKKDSAGKWQKPVSVGLPINSVENEEGLFVSLDGSMAYFASDRFNDGDLSKRNFDIYTLMLNSDLAPETVTYVQGNVIDGETKKKLASKIEFIDLKTGKVVNETLSDISNGEYLLCLEAGKDYAMNISMPGYVFFSQNFSLIAPKAGETFKLDAGLRKIKAGEKAVLKNIFFETNSSALKSESEAELDILVKFLKDNPNLKIEIEGHTDNVGAPADNLQLSEQRAKSVYEALIHKGVEKSRLSFMGLGETLPIAKNETEEGRAQNRRTEFRVTAN